MTSAPELPRVFPSPRAIRWRDEHAWATFDPGLVDAVRRARRSRTPERVEHAGVRVHRDASLYAHPAAYRLSIDTDAGGRATIDIEHADQHGVRAALATLSQLFAHDTRLLPRIVIDDHASFTTRGVMLDISRNKVPLMSELERTIDLLADLKFNHLQLYTEHTFAYQGHEAAWRDASPITPDEARALDAYCLDRGIELSANQNCFGHLASWLKLPEYRHLAEIPGDDQEWRFMHFARKGPFSLCPTDPRSLAFVRGLLLQLTPCFSSGRVNIGCDETFDVGWGKSKSVVDRRAAEVGADTARAELFFDFVRAISDDLHGCRSSTGAACTPMMWADIALHHPAMLDRLRPGTIGLAWEYEPTDKFAPWCDTLRQHGLETWVCPGTSTWRSFAGRTRERRENIANAAEQGSTHGASGFLLCDWGDVGHRQHWPLSLMPIAQGASAAWNPDNARTFDTAAAAGTVHAADPVLGDWLESLGDIDVDLRTAAKLRNATTLFNDLHSPLNIPEAQRPIQLGLEHWLQARSNFETLAAACPTVTDPLLAAELRHTLSRLDLATSHAIAARTRVSSNERSRLRALASEIITEHERLWAFRNRPGGLRESTAHDRAILSGIG